MPNLHQAQRMVDLFTSVGAESFAVTNTDINENRIWPLSYHRSIGKRWARSEDSHFSAPALQHALAHMLELAARRKRYTLPDGRTIEAGENLIIRPISSSATFVQLDDLNAEQLDRVQPAAFLIIATSPGNHQAWIAVSGVDKAHGKDFVRRVRKAVGDADMSASGATRVAGVENFKVKYWPDYPTVTILHGVPGRLMTPDQLQQMNLLAEPEPVKSFPLRVSSSRDRSWPDYERCVQGAPINHGKTGPDISKADFFFALMSAQRGRTIDEIAERLMDLSSKAKENGEQYARITAENATAAASRGRQRSRA